MKPDPSVAQEMHRKAEMYRREQGGVDRERLQVFNESRDPIFNAIYRSMENTRKWIVFIGVVIIVGIAIGILAALGSVVGLYL